MTAADYAPLRSEDGLRYPLKEIPGTGDGSAVSIAPGVLWMRMPMGGGLAFINIWALADEDGWTIVDTGLRTPDTVNAWRTAFAGALGGKPIKRVFATHLHPDHSGMAGWLCNRTGARLWMTRLEYLMLRVLANDTGREAPPEGIRFYQAAGWDEDAVDRYRARFGEFGKLLYPIPNAFRCIVDGERIRIGGWEWEVVVGVGHSPEHACLYSSELNLLISGDQILPRISSNVSVHALEPEADPLSDWLRTLADIATRVPDDVLVLPAHGEPFFGLHSRIKGLIDGHESALMRVHAVLEQPSRPIDLFKTLFRRPITPELYGMATGESLAHLSCLRTRGLARREIDTQGVAWWQAVAR